MSINYVEVLLSLRGLSAFTRGLGEAGAELKTFQGAATSGNAKSALSGVAGLASTAAKGVAVASLAAVVAAGKLGITFEQEMLKVQTGAGLAASQLHLASQAVLDMAQHTAQGPDELAKGLFHLISLGVPLKTALQGLRHGADLAGVSGANLEETMNALGNAWKVQMPGLTQFGATVKWLHGVAGAGNMRLQDLVHTLSAGVLPVAKLAGIGFKDVGIALAILADEGIKGYSAGAQLRTSFHYLYAPTGKAATALDNIGLSAKKLGDIIRDPHRGLFPALISLREHLGLTHQGLKELVSGHWENIKVPGLSKQQSLETLGAIFPAGRGTVLQVLMNQADLAHHTTAAGERKDTQIQRIANQLPQSIVAWHQTAAFKIHNAWARLQVDLIRLWLVIKKPATDAALAIFHALGWVVGGLKDVVLWLEKHKATATILGVAIAGLVTFMVAFKLALIASGLAAATAEIPVALFWLAALSPVALVIAGIAAVVVVLALLGVKFGWLKTIVVGVFNWIVDHWRLLLLVMTGPIGLVIVFIVDHFNTIKSVVMDALKWVAQAFSDVWGTIGGTVSSVFDVIVSIIKTAFGVIFDVINTAIHIYNTIVGVVGGTPIPDVGFSVSTAAAPVVTSNPDQTGAGGGGASLAHIRAAAGAQPGRSNPLAKISTFGGLPPITVHTTVHMNGKPVAHAVGKATSDAAARR